MSISEYQNFKPCLLLLAKKKLKNHGFFTTKYKIQYSVCLISRQNFKIVKMF